MTRHAFLSQHRQSSRRKGFTLIEILVVLGIAAIVTSITVGGFKAMRDGNKRVACQTNLTQIYQAARLYAADEGGKFPYREYATPNDCNTTPSGIGFWSLYTFHQKEPTVDFDKIAPVGTTPVERYLRSTKVLHCPSDTANSQLYLDPVAKDEYNPDYLSYQTCDDGVPTYTTSRLKNKSQDIWRHQLMHYDGTDLVARQPTGDTIVTWCIYHRNERGMDNVLFYDGSVQLLPRLQDTTTLGACPTVSSTCVGGWLRRPKAPQ